MLDWLERRWGARNLLNKFLQEPVPAKGRWFYTLGSATLTAFVLQVVTGTAMLFFYVPSVDQAHESVVRIMEEVPLGWLIRSLHFWSASAMVLLLLLHMGRVFFAAAYKYPRETTWILGVLLFFTTATQFYTGNLLGFHDFGYWSAAVGTYFAKYVPFVGDALYAVVVGGDFVGQGTLSRFFLLHVLVLPLLIVLFVSSHLLLVIRLGEFGWWVNYREFRAGAPPPGVEQKKFEPGAAEESVPFFPRQAIRDATTSLLLLATLFGLAVVVRAPIFSKADPATLDFIPRAQWLFMPYQRLLDFMPGGLLTTLATWVFLVVLFAAMVSLPFLDRDPERNPFRRPALTMLGITAILFFGMLFVIEVTQDPAIREMIQPEELRLREGP
jgi:ubiquinol-cytochrome c reductase cytochrome b subunit